jgi:hypothetical protein
VARRWESGAPLLVKQHVKIRSRDGSGGGCDRHLTQQQYKTSPADSSRRDGDLGVAGEPVVVVDVHGAAPWWKSKSSTGLVTAAPRGYSRDQR